MNRLPLLNQDLNKVVPTTVLHCSVAGPARYRSGPQDLGVTRLDQRSRNLAIVSLRDFVSCASMSSSRYANIHALLDVTETSSRCGIVEKSTTPMPYGPAEEPRAHTFQEYVDNKH